MKKTFLLLSLFAANAIVFSACSDDDNVNPSPTLTEQDRAFMVQASHTNYAEVEMGRLADSVSTNDSVNVFGQMMMTEHTASQNDLVALGNNWNVTLPITPDSMQLVTKARLMLMTGYMFDTAYINAQVMGHQQAVAMFQYAADSSRVGSVKSYAAKYLPGIRMHLEHALRIQAMLSSRPQ